MPGPCRTLLLSTLPVALAACAGPGAGRPSSIAGSLLVTLEDADAPPTVFLDGSLEGREPFARDTMTVIRLPLPQTAPGEAAISEYAQTLAPNSVAGAPTSLAVAPDGSWAVAASMRDGALDIHERLADLAPLSRLTLFDLRAWPVRETDSSDGAAQPISVDIHPAGARLCAVSAETGNLVIIEVRARRFREIVRIPLAEALGLDGAPVDARWSPDGGTIAICLGRGGVAFVAVDLTALDRPTVRLVGGAHEAGRFARTGRWTPDGAAFLALDTGWIDAPRGWSALANAGGAHLISPVAGPLASVSIDGNPHAIAMHPDGSRAIVTGLAKADPAEPDPSLRRGGSLTMLRVDSESIEAIDRVACGSLPMDATFDASGAHALVADFATGRIEVFDVRRRRLVFTGLRVETNYGVHQVRVAP